MNYSFKYYFHVCVCGMYVHLCTCVHVCVETWLWKCTWRPKIDIKSSWMVLHLIYLGRGSLLNTELVTVASLASSLALGPPVSAFGVLEL